MFASHSTLGANDHIRKHSSKMYLINAPPPLSKNSPTASQDTWHRPSPPEYPVITFNTKACITPTWLRFPYDAVRHPLFPYTALSEPLLPTERKCVYCTVRSLPLQRNSTAGFKWMLRTSCSHTPKLRHSVKQTATSAAPT